MFCQNIQYNSAQKKKVETKEMGNLKMKMVLFMLMVLIVSINGETKEECYTRCIDDCGRAGVQCIKVCAISRRCNDKPPPATAAVSRSSSAATDAKP